VARTVEAEFVGAPVGIMDQVVRSVGRDGQTILLDTRTLESQASMRDDYAISTPEINLLVHPSSTILTSLARLTGAVSAVRHTSWSATVHAVCRTRFSF
jgi:galactokinase